MTLRMKTKADLFGLISMAAGTALSASETMVLKKLVSIVPEGRWCYPSPAPDTLQRQAREWSAAALAAEEGRSARTWQRALRSLRDRGLVRCYDRNHLAGLTNGYELVLDGLAALGRRVLGEGEVRRARPLQAAPQGPSLPSWARSYARRLGVPAEQLLALVMGVVRGAVGELALAENELRQIARRMCWLWHHLGPLAAVEQVVDAAVHIFRAVDSGAWGLAREIRATGGEGGPRWGQARAWDLQRALARRSRYPELLAMAREHQAATPASAPGVARVPEGQAGAVAWPVEDLDARWALACAELRRRLGEDSFGVWIRPLRPVGLADGVLLLESPNPFYTEWLATEYLEVLQVVVGGPVGFVDPPGPGG